MTIWWEYFLVSLYFIPFSYIIGKAFSMGWHEAKLNYHCAIMKTMREEGPEQNGIKS